VIVTSYESPDTLRACLESIAKQVGPEDEVVVADCSAAKPDIQIPGVRLIHFPEKRSVPEMRWTALRQTTGELVAAVESRCIPDGRWLQELSVAHAKYPMAAGIGGPVAAVQGSRLDDGLYFC
jgi:hypothetical protein